MPSLLIASTPYSSSHPPTSPPPQLAQLTKLTRPTAISTISTISIAQELAGYFGGFSYRSLAGVNYGYLAPHRNVQGPVDGVNPFFTVDGYTDEVVNKGRSSMGGDHLETNYHGKLVRFNCDNFNASEVTVLDLTEYDPDLRGFAGGFQV